MLFKYVDIGVETKGAKGVIMSLEILYNFLQEL